MTKTVRIVIVDDHAMLREGLRTLLSAQPDLLVVGDAENGEAALRVCAETRPAVVLMDMKMPVMDGVAATRRIVAAHPQSKVVALTTFDDDEYVFEALRAGAVGYLLKDAPSERLFEAIRAAARGESFLQPSIASKVVAELSRLKWTAPPKSGPALSVRETEVLRLLARGASNKEIASGLLVSEGTVKNHVTNILTKLGVGDRTQAALRARDLGVV